MIWSLYKTQGKDQSFAPFRCPNGDPHSNIPGQRTDRPNITMQPLLQIAIVNIFIHKHPEQPEKVPTDIREKQKGTIFILNFS